MPWQVCFKGSSGAYPVLPKVPESLSLLHLVSAEENTINKRFAAEITLLLLSTSNYYHVLKPHKQANRRFGA